MQPFAPLALCGALLPLALALAPEPPAAEDAERRIAFSRDVRPILSAKCYRCHGPHAEARQADLRLDLAALRDDPRGVLVPGAPDESLLFQRIAHADPDERMPPVEAKKSLTADEVDILRRWIEEGATFEDHWSFLPVAAEDPPETWISGWPRNPIDGYVLAALEERGLSPSPQADRRTLLRRVTFDLTGLPPTPDEIAAFLADESSEAYERVVDRLLASKAYAERMTLAWMDAARYGDTSVFHADGPREMWPWRDWVISAYDRNLPFDRFTLEQLAGDLLPDATLDERIAAGFLRNNGTSDEGGAIDEELRVSYMIDRVKTVGNVWLGLSIECAQCHAHKFDPISQEDYYSFFAYFNRSVEVGMQTRTGNEEPLVRVPDAEQASEEERLTRELELVSTELAEARLPEAELAAWASSQRVALDALIEPTLSDWSSLGPFPAATSAEAFATAFGPETGVDLSVTVGALTWTPRPEWSAAQVHAFPPADNAATYLHRTITVPAATGRRVSLGSDDTLSVWLNGEQLLANESYRGAAPDQDLVDLDLVAGENELLLKVVNGGGPSGFYFRLLGLALPEPVIEVLALDATARSPDQDAVLAAHFRRAEWAPGVALAAREAALEAEQTALRAAIPTVMSMRDAADGRMTYVLDRGQYDAPNEARPVEPSVLEFLLPAVPDAPADRLGLARWLVDPEHPLTARVAVNRYWALLFGTGLVESVMDFGSQGSFPSHPELLDWLAADFVASGWNVKRALRQMVTSATYRQASVRRPELAAADPENRLLGRASRLRLQAEFLRDQALAASGLLVAEVGGPGVKPYQPPGLWNEVSLDKNVRFERDSGDKLYRRSMYIYWKRSAPMPAMTTFDAPTRETCLVARQRTNTPLQALVTLNDEQFVEAARFLAERMLAGADDFAGRLDVGFELCTGRPADDLRREILFGILTEEKAAFRAAPERAGELLAVGDGEPDPALDPVEHAAWTVVASMLLNLDESLNRE